MGRDFDKQRERGRVVELAVASWLMARGWRILPAYDFSGKADDKAPKLMAAPPAQSLVLPDLLTCRDGQSCWVEVKLKTRADLHRKTQTLETGISLRLFRHYQEVSVASGLDVHMMFAHEAENELRAAPLSWCVKTSRLYEGEKMGRGGMAFFPYLAMRRLAALDEILPPPVAPSPAWDGVPA